MFKGRRLGWQLADVVSGRVFAAAAQMLSVVLLARWSDPAEFGIVIAVQSVVTAMTWTTGMGLGAYMSVVRAREPNSRKVHEIYALNRASSAVLVTALGGVWVVSLSWNPIAIEFWPLILAVGLQRNAAVLNSIAVADGQTQLFSSNLALRRLLALIVFWVAATYLMPVVLSFCLSIAISEAFCNWKMRKGIDFKSKQYRLSNVKSIVRQSSPFWLNTVSGQIRMLDVALVGVLMGPVASAMVAVPSKIASPIMLIPTSLATILLPKVSADRSVSGKKVLTGAILLALFLAICLIVVGFFIEFVIAVSIGEGFIEAASVTRIYFIGFVGLSLVYVINAALQGWGMHSAVSRVSLAGSLCSLVGIVIGGLCFGLVFSAWGYVLGVGFQLLLLSILWFRRPISVYESGPCLP